MSLHEKDRKKWEMGQGFWTSCREQRERRDKQCKISLLAGFIYGTLEFRAAYGDDYGTEE